MSLKIGIRKKMFMIVLSSFLLLSACKSKEENINLQNENVFKTNNSESTSNTPPESRIMIVDELIGSAFLFSLDSPEELLVTLGMTITEKDIIVTEKDSTMTLTFDNDKKIYVAPQTEFAISALSNDDGEKTILALKNGNIINDVKDVLNDNDVYEIHTKNLVVSITGTTASISQGKESTGVTLLGGSSIVTLKNESEDQYLVGMGERLNSNLQQTKIIPLDNNKLYNFEKNFLNINKNNFSDLLQHIENDNSNYQPPNQIEESSRHIYSAHNNNFSNDYLDQEFLSKSNYTNDYLNDIEKNQYDYPSYSYNNYSYNEYSYHSYDSSSYDNDSYDSPSYDTNSYDSPSYDTNSYDSPSYDNDSYESYSYDSN